MAVNKVVKSDGTTLIDISGTTATVSDVAEGKVFYGADGTEQTGTAVMGGGSAISVVDTTDSHGGTIRTITAVDLSADTVTAATLLQGYTAHDRLGNAITGTASGGASKFTITLTKNASTGVWEPDCTYAQAVAAYTGGDYVTYFADGGTVEASYDEFTGIYYTVYEYFAEGFNNLGYHVPSYLWTAGGVTEQYSETAYITSQANATPADVASGKKFFNADGYQVGTANGGGVSLQSKTKTYTPTESQQTETITADSNYDGLSQVGITVNAVSSTYVGTGVTRQAAKTVTPTKSSQTAVASGVYTTGAVTVAAIPAQYITTTDATATAAQINSGATAYVNGVKVTGTQVIQHYYTGSSDPSASTGSDGDIYLKVVT